MERDRQESVNIHAAACWLARETGKPVNIWVKYGPANAWGYCQPFFSVLPAENGKPGRSGEYALWNSVNP